MAAFTLALGVTAAPAQSRAADVRFGIGGGIGDPLGPSAKLFVHPQHAFQFDFGWALMHHFDGILTANYLFHFKPFVQKSAFDFGMYLGVGVGLAFWAGYHRGDCFRSHLVRDPDRCRGYYGYYYGHGRIAGHGGAAMVVRAPVGFFFMFKKVPLDTVIEGGWSPYVVPPWDPFHGDFSVKVRYYF